MDLRRNRLISIQTISKVFATLTFMKPMSCLTREPADSTNSYALFDKKILGLVFVDLLEICLRSRQSSNATSPALTVCSLKISRLTRDSCQAVYCSTATSSGPEMSINSARMGVWRRRVRAHQWMLRRICRENINVINDRRTHRSVHWRMGAFLWFCKLLLFCIKLSTENLQGHHRGSL